MFIGRLVYLCLLPVFFVSSANAYDLTGVDASYNFGTITAPFPDLTLTDGSICVGYTAVVEASTYRVRATSSGSASTAFQMTNSLNSAYKLDYSVSWAGSSGGTPSFVSLSSGQNSTSTFPAQLLGGLTCLVLPNNATMRLQLLGANQVLAKQGSYTDTLTILIVAP
ncbi:hypothetical protein Lqui_0133 [Legionella quinlivanii]|uniref:Spore coat protein U domain-containing protein n=1 Tax=Legionella quinlivanii TaxID=45073 RepID=A0A0W0Y6K4_9GAMM|nr:hypothetical protein [Legionella quinlivanii]KTD52567.1 hypothetical protein Lqui_0133 [Legionella quinlivanii]MCW8449733.1 hypothetical protein [Legionella quinlivanii]RAP35767.1 hypothetical protein B1207_11855 [Legionella quinlivanii]SEF70841.1 hypothetical protein SAMN02746093_00820 [Legionella quinlivanii DSM 21216]STY12116.1 Uncharacterised protein [Legionella quinlivanii]